MARAERKDRGLFVYCLADGTTRYGVRLWRHGQAHTWKGFRRKDAARNWYDDRKQDVRAGKPFPGRGTSSNAVASVIDRYLAQARHKKGYGNEQVYATFWTKKYGQTRVQEITPLSIEQARTRLLTQGSTDQLRPLSPATVNRYVAWLKHVLMIEERQGRLEKNPCRAIQKFKEAPPPEEQFTDAEEAALRTELGSDWDYVRLAILTGLRQEEEFTLAWARLDFARGFGKLPAPKGGEPEIFLLSDEASAILNARRNNGSPWVFPHPRDPSQPMNGKSWYNHVFKPACRRAGIELSRAKGKTWHTLRHTFAARLQEAGVPVGDIKDLGRWKSWKAMDRYLKRGTLRLRSAIQTIATATATKPPLT